MKKNKKIENFIHDTLFIDEEKGDMLISLRKLFLKIVPKTEEGIKYGGLVFLIENNLFSGIFIRKNHISVEFVKGVEMRDPDKFLEGSGKFRRHLKLFHQEDIKNKKVEYYIKQSVVGFIEKR